MAKRGKEKAGMILEKTLHGVRPISAFDAEQLDRFPVGTEFNLAPRTKRSLPQHRTYWKALSDVVKATDAWPTPEHLHDALKHDLGYVEVRKTLAGMPYISTESTAFDAMTADEFRSYMDRAMARLAEVTGINPLHFLDEAA